VFSRTAFGLANTTRPDMRLDDPRDSTAFDVASIATSSLSTNDCACGFSAAGSVATRPIERTDPRFGDRDLAEVTMHFHTDAAHSLSRPAPTSTTESREPTRSYGHVR
jgi:hypothetical protein